jgi:hypothetical protein
MLQHTFNVNGNALNDRLEILAPAKVDAIASYFDTFEI